MEDVMECIGPSLADTLSELEDNKGNFSLDLEAVDNTLSNKELDTNMSIRALEIAISEIEVTIASFGAATVSLEKQLQTVAQEEEATKAINTTVVAAVAKKCSADIQ